MKILLINQTFYPDAASTAQHLTDLAADLVTAGHEVTVLASHRCYEDPKVKYPRREVYRGIKIVRVPAPGFGKQSKTQRVLEAFCINLFFAWNLFWLPRFDQIIALTSPPLVSFVAALFSKLRRSEMVSWMMDVNPDEAILAGWIAKDSLYAKILQKTLQWTLKKSSKIIVLDQFMKERILLKGAKPEKVRVIPPWTHDEDIEPVPKEDNPFCEKYGLKNKFVVLYSGNHSLCHPLETLLHAAEALKDQKEIVFLFIGGGERVKEVLDFKEEHQLSNLLYLPYQERSSLKYSLSAGDLHAVTMGDDYAGVVHPSKIYNSLKIGKPILYIGPQKSAISEMLERENWSYCVGHGNVKGVQRAILTVKETPFPERQKIREKATALAAKFSRHLLSQEMIRFLTES